jgi:DMSO/TMAO reductase YedYZ molybdopterin-dependent catalytic subunit
MIRALLLCSVVLSAQTEPKLTIGGDVAQPLTLTRSDLAKMPRSSAVSGEREKVGYEGVLLYEILKRAGAPVDKQLGGKAIATYILAEARDGYQAVYSITEADPAIGDASILVADTAGGKPISDENGPFRVVVPSDKKAARSVRMLEKITVVRLRK